MTGLTRTVLAALALLAFQAVGAASSPAEDRAEPRQSQQTATPTLKVYTRETVVDVTVTDSHGNPVHDLKQSDFIIKQDGKPQIVSSFRESSTPAARIPPKLPPDVYSNVGATPASGPVYIFLLDTLNTDPTNAERFKLQMVQYLKRLPAETQVAVFGMSIDWGGRMLQSFTSDGASLAVTASAFDADWVRHPVPPEVYTQLTLRSFDQIAAYVAGIKGRKNLVWFTTRMPFIILRDGGASQPGPPPPGVSFEQIRELYDLLTAEQIALYPVHVGGAGLIPPLFTDVASATGGKAFGGSNDLISLIAGAVESGRSAYTLSYTPPPFANDGRFHTLEITTDRPGLHLVYRNGFNAESPDVSKSPALAPGPQLMQAAMGGGAPPATQLLFDVRVQPSPVSPSTAPPKPTDPPILGELDPRFKKAHLTRYSLLYLLPVSQIAFADAPEKVHSGSVEFDVAAFDDAGMNSNTGKMVSVLSQTIRLPLTPEEYAQFLKTPFQFFQQIDLPPGRFLLRVGILDGVSNKVGTLEIPLTVPKATVASKLVAPAPQPPEISH